MKKQAKGPKFRAGQVVFVRAERRYALISSKSLQGRWYYWEANKSIGWGERELRPLTAREAGPARGRKRTP